MQNRLHEPPNATEYIESTRSGTMRRATTIGSSVAEVRRRLFEQKGVDSLRPARAVVALGSTYRPERLHAACACVLA